MKPVGDPVKPKIIIKNLFAKWYRVGTLLNTTLQILQKAFKCLVYKHFSILLTLIRVEISRNNSQKRATNWSVKAKVIVADIIMKMAALHFTDGVLLRISKFLDIYEKGSDLTIDKKFNYTPFSLNCYKFHHSDPNFRISEMKEIASELKVRTVLSLFNTSESKLLDDDTFKDMFTSSMDRIKEQFSGLPYTIGMSSFQWNNIMHFEKRIRR